MIVNYYTVILLSFIVHIQNCKQYLMLFTLYSQVCQLLKRNANQNSADDQGQVRFSSLLFTSFTFVHSCAY